MTIDQGRLFEKIDQQQIDGAYLEDSEGEH